MSNTELVARMAEVLAGTSVTLTDERACMRVLQDAKFKIVDITCDCEAAQQAAQALRAKAEVAR